MLAVAHCTDDPHQRSIPEHRDSHDAPQIAELRVGFEAFISGSAGNLFSQTGNNDAAQKAFAGGNGFTPQRFQKMTPAGENKFVGCMDKGILVNRFV